MGNREHMSPGRCRIAMQICNASSQKNLIWCAARAIKLQRQAKPRYCTLSFESTSTSGRSRSARKSGLGTTPGQADQQLNRPAPM